ncbi:UvrD-helicase domain-containing protein [Methylophilaceae bacterium]|nr:UvrD-helicase domain-containing protein [Methylophilaceae bacterium]
MDNLTQQPSDHQVRKKALGQGSFIVQAPAGSGKTSLLVKRFLYRLLEVKSPKEVLALTFTNKAAAEMAQRLKEALEEKSKDNEIKKIVEKISKHALKNKWDEGYIDTLMVMTIDKLALRLIKQTPILSSSGVNFLTDEDPDDLYRETIRETITSNAENHLLFKYFDYDYHKLTEQLLALISKRDQWLPIVSGLLRSDDKNIEEIYGTYYTNELNIWVEEKIKPNFTNEDLKELEIIVSYLADNKNIDRKDKLRSSINYEFWFYIRDLILTKSGKQIRKKIDTSSGFPATNVGKEIKERLLKLIKLKNNKFNILIDFFNVTYHKNIVDIYPLITPFCLLLIDMVTRLNEKFKERRIIDFTQIMGNAVEALRDTHLPLILDQNISHILVDEFQDTNESQLIFIELLTQNFAGNPDKSFFAVGDPMQSIYRFRKAEVEIFSRVQKSGISDLKLTSLFLKVNFRSNKNIIDWLNNSFSKAFPLIDDSDEGSVPYSSCESSNNNLEGGMELIALTCDTKSKTAQYEAEALYVLNLIKDTRKSNPDASIAVLTRSKAHLNELITLINKKDSSIPIDAIEMSKILSNQTFQDILCLTKALFDFSDRTNWIAALKSPWCGLSINDLVLLFEKDHKSLVWELINNIDNTRRLDKNSARRLRGFVEVIRENIQYRGRISHRYFVEGIWRQLNGEESMVDSNDIQNIDLFLELLEEASEILSIDFIKLERLIENKFISKTSIQKNSIKFLTIQKSKGLEFDNVIIPNLNKRTRNEESDLVLYDKSTLSIKNPGSDKNLHSYHAYKERKRLDNEKIRLLYVAMTRAKNKCYLIGTVKKEDDLVIPNSGTFMNILWPFFSDKFTEIATPEDENSFEKFIPKLRRLNDNFYSGDKRYKRSIDTEELSFCYPNISTNIQRFTGNIVHKYLEIIVKKQLDIDKLLCNKLDYTESLYLGKNFKKKDIKIGLNLVQKSLEMLKKTSDGRWILNRYLADNSEVSYLLESNNTTTQHIPDRSFIENDIQWIIDYKTPFSPIKNLAVEAKKHLPQLRLYETIFKRNKRVIQKAIYFAPQGKLIKL